MIAIVDYNAGNLRSVKKALDYLKSDSMITSDPDDISQAEKIVFPGVGSFGESVFSLEEKNLTKVLKEFINDGKPFLGICLGLQLLFENSEESPKSEGLSILKGKVVKYKKGKIPQIGWNEVIPHKKIFKRGYAYFVNSYYVAPIDGSIIACTTEYEGKEFVSAIRKKNITAVQFHPEKSGSFGLRFLKDWIEC